MTFSSFGYLIGSLSGALYKWINRQLTIVTLCIVLATTIALVPHFNQLWILFVALVFNGIGGGTWDSNNNVWLVEMWPTFNAPLIQVSQFMYGLGTIIGPIIVSPYVHGDNTNTTNWSPEFRRKELTFPFALTGIIQAIVPVSLFVAFFVVRYRKNDCNKFSLSSANYCSEESTIEAIRPQQHDHPNVVTAETSIHVVLVSQVSNRRIKLFLMALCLAMYDAAEIAYFYFSPSMFQWMKPIEMPADEAAHVASILSAAYTIGRLCTAFISIKLKPDVIISYHFVIIFIGMNILYFGRDNRTTIIVGTIILGSFFGFLNTFPLLTCILYLSTFSFLSIKAMVSQQCGLQY